MSRVAVIGAHRRTGAHVVTQLLAAGHAVVGTVRDPEHVAALHADGATGVVVDLMTATPEELTAVLTGTDAVVYAAGSGWGDTRDLVERLDRDAIMTAADASVAAGVGRFVLVSAHRTDEDLGDPVVDVLLRAKRTADADLRGTVLGWTIIRPDALTQGAQTGGVHVGTTVPHGAIARADLAALIVAVLADPTMTHQQFDVIGGDTRTADAINSLRGFVD